VQALVYLNGWLCDAGESQQQLLERFQGSLVGPAVRPVLFTPPTGPGADLFLAPALFRDAFAADLDPEWAAVLAAAQRPYAAAAVHGRARECHHRGGGGLSRLVPVPARGRDPAHRSGRRGHPPQPLTNPGDDPGASGMTIRSTHGSDPRDERFGLLATRANGQLAFGAPRAKAGPVEPSGRL
jgi:hypothetical protein